MRARTPFQRIDSRRAETLFARGNLVVLDVRDAGSFDHSHIDGAQHVTSANLSAVLGATAKTRAILIYCYHGNASREYAQIFSDFGFAEVYSLDGGYEAWCTRPSARGDTVLASELQQWLVAQRFPSPTSTPLSQTPRQR
jgi:thiosulfate/3-mercaptopyruvate sulfurtransferase